MIGFGDAVLHLEKLLAVNVNASIRHHSKDKIISFNIKELKAVHVLIDESLFQSRLLFQESSSRDVSEKRPSLLKECIFFQTQQDHFVFLIFDSINFSINLRIQIIKSAKNSTFCFWN